MIKEVLVRLMGSRAKYPRERTSIQRIESVFRQNPGSPIGSVPRVVCRKGLSGAGPSPSVSMEGSLGVEWAGGLGDRR